jgi:hypothetical protein
MQDLYKELQKLTDSLNFLPEKLNITMSEHHLFRFRNFMYIQQDFFSKIRLKFTSSGIVFGSHSMIDGNYNYINFQLSTAKMDIYPRAFFQKNPFMLEFKPHEIAVKLISDNWGAWKKPEQAFELIMNLREKEFTYRHLMDTTSKKESFTIISVPNIPPSRKILWKTTAKLIKSEVKAYDLFTALDKLLTDQPSHVLLAFQKDESNLTVVSLDVDEVTLEVTEIFGVHTINLISSLDMINLKILIKFDEIHNFMVFFQDAKTFEDEISIRIYHNDEGMRNLHVFFVNEICIVQYLTEGLVMNDQLENEVYKIGYLG